MTSLREIQRECSDWIRATFGMEYLTNKQERAMRVLEEATELAQSLGLDKDLASKVLDQVYTKPVDPDVGKEVAGVIVCAMGAASACDVDALDAYDRERIWRHMNQQLCREKHAKKTAVAIQGNYKPEIING